MASRRTKENVRKERDSSEEDVGSSQPSTTSTDEQELMAMLKFKAKRDKEQAKLLADLKKEVKIAKDKKTRATIDRFVTAMDELAAMNTEYVLEQDKANETIRRLWVQVFDAQVEFSNYTNDYLKRMKGLEENRNRRQLEHLSLQKRACQDHQSCIDNLKESPKK
ncbi:hypothetical protein M408DRAFT_330913 [Serendipita vermifera MAFF 305830]|uniref:Uncharacterized protein n=1 Tax=Serendipita vermifera MAFF 305830 TaxID=933852 RepID=A0A0C3AMV5_SERVB|nr:hypothetical protein M408DRAFT_330913 [Serendipita vermifera MAFF 305830]